MKLVHREEHMAISMRIEDQVSWAPYKLFAYYFPQVVLKYRFKKLCKSKNKK